MTSGTVNLDILIKEYLIFRGFIQSAKQLDGELKGDRDKGFKAELVVDRITSFVTSHDLQNLKDFWHYLDSRVFSRLELPYHNSTKKLYFGILKYYVVYAAFNNKYDKVSEFFTKLAPELLPHSEWKDWFALPFIKHPEANEIFSTFFTKQWQDALQLSLFNYISVVFQSMPTPSLMDVQRPASGTHKVEGGRRKLEVGVLRGSVDMVDDFFTLTQNINLEDPNIAKVKAKSIVAKGLAKVKGHNPVPGRSKSKPPILPAPVSSLSLTNFHPQPHELLRVTSTPGHPINTAVKPKRPLSTDHNEMRQELLSVPSNVKTAPSTTAQEMTSSVSRYSSDSECEQDFILSGHHTYSEHGNSITHAKFSKSAHVIASADIDGVVKVWTREAVPNTIATFISKQTVLSLEFVDRTDGLLLIGSKPGHVKVFETSTKKSLQDILVTDETSSTKISDLSVDNSGHYFACSTLINGATAGLISIWNINTADQLLHHDDDAVQSLEYFHDGNNLLMGCVDGSIKILDLRQANVIKSWKAHSGKVYSMQLSTGGESCFTMDSDNTVSQWNLSSGRLVQSFSVHEGAAGPYVFSQTANHKQIQTPKDQIIALNARNTHFLTCHKHNALIYKIIDGEAKRSQMLTAHHAPVVAVDWAAGDTDTCLTADMLGDVRLSTLLK